MNHRTHSSGLIILCTLASILVTGCNPQIKPPKEAFAGYVGREKIPLKVGLNITDELLKSKYEKHVMGGTLSIPIGGSLATNAGVLARHTFDNVVDMKNGQLPSGETVAAVLTPKLAYIGRTTGATSFGESVIDIKVEWTLIHPDGNQIWVETVDGKGTGSTGWSSPESILKKSLDDLMLNSELSLTSAQAIREFAQKK